MSSYYSNLGQLISNAGNQDDYFFGVGSFHGVRREDVIFGRRPAGSNQLHFRVSRQLSDGSFQDTGWWDGNFGFYYSTILVADIDGDDYDDLVAITHQGGNTLRVTWARNTQNESFASGSEMRPDYGNSCSRYYAADVDQDGHDDIVMISPSGNVYWARTYQQGSAWKISGQRNWIRYFAQGSNDQFCFANVTDQVPVQGRNVPDWPELVVLQNRAEISADNSLKLETLTAVPNPFSDQTTLRLSVDSATEPIQLSVFDIRGRLVRSFQTEAIRAGPQEVVWDGRGNDGQLVSAGLYLIRMRTPKQQKDAKVLLLRR